MKSINALKRLVAASALLCAAASSQASIVPLGTIYDTGSGFGNVNTVLTLDNLRSGEASGAVTRSGGTDHTSGDTKPGQVHNATWSFGELNISDSVDLLIIFNATEPGNDDANGVTLQDLVLSIYSDVGGVALFSASLIAPQVYTETENGIGKAGFAFGLDALQAAQAQQFVSAGNRIGLAASLLGATGGPDTFYVAALEDDGGGPGNEIPEPGSVALLGLGIAGLWAARRRASR